MNGKTKDHPYSEHAEQLIKVYVPDTEELALDFGGLYAVACERDEAAAKALEMDCEAA